LSGLKAETSGPFTPISPSALDTRRPLTLQELTARSRPTGYDPSKSLKALLWISDAELNAGQQAEADDDLESAFLSYSKASTLLLEELPTHPEFSALTPHQIQAIKVVSALAIDLDRRR
jgi:hypothetical protein